MPDSKLGGALLFALCVFCFGPLLFLPGINQWQCSVRWRARPGDFRRKGSLGLDFVARDLRGSGTAASSLPSSLLRTLRRIKTHTCSGRVALTLLLRYHRACTGIQISDLGVLERVRPQSTVLLLPRMLARCQRCQSACSKAPGSGSGAGSENTRACVPSKTLRISQRLRLPHGFHGHPWQAGRLFATAAMPGGAWQIVISRKARGCPTEIVQAAMRVESTCLLDTCTRYQDAFLSFFPLLLSLPP